MADVIEVRATVKEKLANLKPDRFYCTPHESYGLLGWFETAIKVLGCVLGIGSMSAINVGLSSYPQIQNSGPRIAMIIITGLLFFWRFFVPIWRFKEGELFAVVFSILEWIANGMMLFGEIFAFEPSPWMFGWAFLYLLGDLIKLMFLRLREDFEVVWFDRTRLTVITAFTAVLEAVIVILQIVNWLTTYTNPGQ